MLTRKMLLTFLLLMTYSSLGTAQVTTTSRISGIVMDQTGAVVPGAQIMVKSQATGGEFRATSSNDGTFVIPSLTIGFYTVTITAAGFKQLVVKHVKTEIGSIATVDAKLEAGDISESVTVTGGSVLQTRSTSVGVVITGRQITELPLTSRNALELVLALPGTVTVGGPRNSSVNGLPKGAINISTDGINVQDLTSRSTDGFFAFIHPRVGAIEEVQVSTATPGAEASGGGAIHIRFVTKAGTNEYHGGAWWYHRQRALNSNYYFNNLNNIPRSQVLLNQWGFSVGGPITPWLKDRAFFFFAFDEFRLPSQTSRPRTILNPAAQAGFYNYPGGPTGGVNLLALAAANGFPGTFDPTIAKALADIRVSTAKGEVRNLTDPNLQQFTFLSPGNDIRRLPTMRFDFNLTKNHQLEAIYNYQDFVNTVDFLNNADPAFPEPAPKIFGSQSSNRFSFSTALRSTLGSTLVSEIRFGLTGGTAVFFPEIGPASFAPFGGIAPAFNVSALPINNPFSRTDNARRNQPLTQFADNLSWSKGLHNLNFGGSYSRASFFLQDSGGTSVARPTFGISAADPISGIFNPTTIPGATNAQLNQARALYALLTGRIDQVGFNGKLDEETKKYSLESQSIQRAQASGFALYFQDYFKVLPNLSFNYGLRWEVKLSPSNTNEVYVRPTYAGLFGVSGLGNLFKPGASGGAVTTYIPVTEDTKPFDDNFGNFAPSIGIAWSPKFGNLWLKRLFGDGDSAVLRAAYSISYVTGGFADFSGIWNNNPGLVQFAGLRAGTQFAPGSLLLRNGIPAITPPPGPNFPTPSTPGTGAFDFDPHLQTPYVQSWTFGIQRELNRDTVLEVRYVGNHSLRLGRSFNLNEVNIFENGFLQEFTAAQNNLAISLANGRGSNFRNQGLPGQVNLPIFTASFGSSTSAQFGNSTFTQSLLQGQAGLAASLLGNTSANILFQNNRVSAGLPANLFIVNPSVLGAAAQLLANGGSSTYNSLQVELRRRLSGGLQVQGNYVWSKALTTNTSWGAQPHAIRFPGLDKGPSPFDIRHAFKANFVYELPVGPGRRFNSRGPFGLLGKAIEGWQLDGIVRWQSGRVFPLSSGRFTVNQFDSGVELVGLTTKELQELVKIRKDPVAATRGTVFWLPDDIILNSQRAFGLRAGENPTGRYIGPPSTPGKFGSYVFLYGPRFFRADLSVIKKTKLTERTDLELRGEFLNAFNNVNFYIGNLVDAVVIPVNTLTIGQTDVAYRDLTTTNDPGGRLIQFVLRLNF